MELSDKEILVDIGGGNGEHFAQLARTYPDKVFLVLDPAVKPLTDKPDNLHLVSWKRDVDSDIPQGTGTISEAHINFVMGEMETSDVNDGSVEDSVKIYDSMLETVDRVLVSGGKVEIVDVRGNIGYIKQLLDKRGYIDTQPRRLEDEHHSEWADVFFKVFHKTGRREDESEALPMIIEARKHL